MSKKINMENGKATLVTNYKPRPLVTWNDLPDDETRRDFAYVVDNHMAENGAVDEMAYDARFFKYRGAWYDSQEFESAPHSIRRHGFDGVQTQSYFDCIALRYFDNDGEMYLDEIIVAHIHW